ncbi:MAG: translation initiation factor IF-3 [Candidatus Gracilibacteria bacterium]|nr:translation initiation factor IF-3 [Candidatus Gracilibacteria bacterium]
MKEPKKNINDEIKAKSIQLITEEGENLGIMPLKEALEKASETGLDLMEMSKKDDLVIAKLIDYGKYLYKLKKLDQKNKQKSKTPELKTVRITFNISEHDLDVKRKQAFSFAKDGNPIKLVLVMKGRENQYGEIARTKILNFITSLEAYYKLDNNVSRVGNMLSANLKPIK